MACQAIASGVFAEMVSRALSLVAGYFLDQQPERSAEAKLPRLRHLLVRVESVAEAAGARRVTSHALLAWLAEIVDGAYRGRYLLDALPSGAGQDEGHAKLVPARSFSLPSSFNPSKRLRVAAGAPLLGDTDELDGVLANLERVTSGLTEFIMMLQMCPPALHKPLPTTSIYADSYMFGRHAETRRVLDFLLQDDEVGEPAVAELGILPIIGAAGLGRTTLVQHVCEDPAVRRRFSLVMMLDFHCMSLMAAGETAAFLRSLFTPSALSCDGGEKLSLLERKLRGERFLAVFDNVDARRRQVVDAIMPTLRRAGTRGSKVIVTSIKGHVGIQDSSLAPLSPRDGGRQPAELPVLLCKSVFPSYCLYYTAHCTIHK